MRRDYELENDYNIDNEIDDILAEEEKEKYREEYGECYDAEELELIDMFEGGIL